MPPVPARDLTSSTPEGGSRPGELPVGYSELLDQLKERVRTSQVWAARAADTELLKLCWSIGRDILDRQDHAGWGVKVIDRLAGICVPPSPSCGASSVRDLHYMRAVAAAWPDEAQFLQSASAGLTWSHVTTLLTRLDDQSLRDWYASAAAGQGWSLKVLEQQIATRLHTRVGAASSNFAAHLPLADSGLAQALTRDSYVFKHLGFTEPVAEGELEQSLMDRLQQTLTAFGHGRAFVGRQVHFPLDDTEMIIDLLLFSIEQVRYVVIECGCLPLVGGKVGSFSPAYTGQLVAYVARVDERLRRPERHAPAVGILLCTQAPREQAVRYALASTAAPVAVASYTYDTLPPEERAALPDAATLADAITPGQAGRRPWPRASSAP